MAAPVWVLTSSEQVFLFLHILANTCYVLSFLILAILIDVSVFIDFYIEIKMDVVTVINYVNF